MTNGNGFSTTDIKHHRVEMWRCLIVLNDDPLILSDLCDKKNINIENDDIWNVIYEDNKWLQEVRKIIEPWVNQKLVALGQGHALENIGILDSQAIAKELPYPVNASSDNEIWISYAIKVYGHLFTPKRPAGQPQNELSSIIYMLVSLEKKRLNNSPPSNETSKKISTRSAIRSILEEVIELKEREGASFVYLNDINMNNIFSLRTRENDFEDIQGAVERIERFISHGKKKVEEYNRPTPFSQK